MMYRKFRADEIFDGYNMYQGEQVLITDEKGIIEGIVPVSEAGADIEEFKGILTPGFINCHCHLELSHMRGRILKGTGLGEFVSRVVTERHYPEQQILDAIEKAEDEMLANGIVAVGDICNNALTIPQKFKGRIWYHNFIEASGFNPALAEERFNRSVAFFTAYGKLYGIPIASNSITPHAPYSVADELWEKILHFPGNHLFTIHNQESAGENEWFQHKRGEMEQLYIKLKMDYSFFKPSGKTSLQTYLPKFLRNQSVILVHNVHTSSDDVKFALNTELQLYWCLCPNANLYISNTLPDIKMLIRNECEIVLGTDSLASNHELNILGEIKTIQKRNPDIPLSTMLKWATSNGARALQLQSLMGSFEKGRQPGVILLDENLKRARRIL